MVCLPFKFRIEGAEPMLALSKTINRPSVSLSAVILAIWLGVMNFPFLKYLQPLGDMYVGLMQMCVLPFLLSAIPLAVRSALTSGAGGKVMMRLVAWLLVAIAVVGITVVLVPKAIFGVMPLDQSVSSRIGTLFGVSAEGVDIEIALNPDPANRGGSQHEEGLLAVVPSNIFAALSSNDSLRVIVFAVIFGAGMAMSERRSGTSIFSALKHVQGVCIMIFDWFNLFVPIGIVALVAPQIARLGRDVYAVLAPFVLAFTASSALLLVLAIFVISLRLRLVPAFVFARMLNPLALAIATRNALVCAPAALEMLKDELRTPPGPCDLFIPMGYALIRFGNIVHFATATLFVGYLMGRLFSGFDLVLVAGFSVMASFATIGVAGVAGLAPLAAVLRPFGLSYELALPLLVVVDPIAGMIRAMLNVALNMPIPVLASERASPVAAVVAAPAE
jgi:Na+/H+-dicarboxylate symporter